MPSSPTLAPSPRFLTVTAAAEYASLSTDSIRKLLAKRQLTPLRPVRGRILIDRLELERLVLGSTTTPVGSRGASRRLRDEQGN